MAIETDNGSLFSLFARFSGKGKTQSPQGLSFLLEGRIERVENGKCWVDQDFFEIGRDTWVVGTIIPGSIVKAKGKFRNGSRLATTVTVC